jgi:hypothetical protein
MPNSYLWTLLLTVGAGCVVLVLAMVTGFPSVTGV